MQTAEILSQQGIRTFRNQLWRHCLEEACEKTRSSLKLTYLDVISPFGFEAINDKQFLTKQLRKFYCYLGIKQQDADIYAVSHAFYQALMPILKIKMPCFYDDLILPIENRKIFRKRGKLYQPLPTDKLLDIQVRHVKTNILDDYSDYIIANIAGILESKGECGDFSQHFAKRSRTFQLYLMLESTFDYLLQRFSKSETLLHRVAHKSIQNDVRPFYSIDLMHTAATLDEMEAYEKLVFPRVEQMLHAVNVMQEKMTLSVSCYHIPDSIEMKLDVMAYQNATNFIQSTYLNFF